MDKNGNIIDQKELKMYEKGKKIDILDLKYLLFSKIFLSGIGGYLPPSPPSHPLLKIILPKNP